MVMKSTFSHCTFKVCVLSINILVSINVGVFGGYDCARVRSRREVHVLILLTRLVRTWSSCLDRIVTSSHLRSDWWKLPKTAKVILPISNCSNDWFR